MIVESDYPALRHIFFNMRAQDRDEVFACFWHDDPELVAYHAWRHSPYRWTADGAAAFGAMPLHPGVWSIWMVATPDFTPATGKEMVRFIRRILRTEMPTRGAHRVECKSLATHTVAHRFIRALGLCEEATQRAYGKGREDFIVFSRTTGTFK